MTSADVAGRCRFRPSGSLIGLKRSRRSAQQLGSAETIPGVEAHQGISEGRFDSFDIQGRGGHWRALSGGLAGAAIAVLRLVRVLKGPRGHLRAWPAPRSIPAGPIRFFL